MTRKIFVALLLLFVSLVPAAQREGIAQTKDSGPTLTCLALPLVAQGFLASHVRYKDEDEALLKRVAKIYAERIDPTQTLLTQAEYAKLEKRAYELAKAVKNRNCADFSKLHKDQIAWHEELENYVKTVTAKDFEIDKAREVELDPDKRKRPASEEELRKLRRSLVEFQMANYLVNGTTKEEATKKLVHRYELITKRIREMKEQDLYGAYLNAYSAALDPHSSYFSPDDMEDFRIQMELSLTGIGAVLTSEDGYTIVEEVVPGGAADRHGKLQPKDRIIAVAQGEKGEPVDVIDMDLRDVVKLIRGKKGTKVTLSILRKEPEPERLTLTIERDQIDLKEQAAKLKWRDVKRGDKTLKLAVLDLPSFYLGDKPGARDSAEDVAKLVAEAKEKKADGIVLDLSRNGGGALQSAVAISGLFIEQGAIVGVGSKTAKAGPEVLDDQDPKVQWDGPLVVLTSKASASASEILAGALKDYRRAIVVGDEHTYGKGTVQQLSPLPPGLGLLKVTTALFFLPGGDSTQSVGVEADIVIPSVLSSLDIGEKHQDNALEPVSVKPFTSAKANGSNSWKPIEDAVVTKLRKKSQRRVAKDKEFKELAKELEKVNGNDTKIKLAEIFENGKSDDDDEATDKKDELSIQAKEASEILADLALAL